MLAGFTDQKKDQRVVELKLAWAKKHPIFLSEILNQIIAHPISTEGSLPIIEVESNHCKPAFGWCHPHPTMPEVQVSTMTKLELIRRLARAGVRVLDDPRD